MDNTTYDITKDFLSPASITIIPLLLGYFISRYRDSRKSENEQAKVKLSYIDFFILQANSLSNTFERFTTDLDEKAYFDYKNINSASNIAFLLQNKTENVIIFSDDNLRKQIITTVDLATKLMNDIRNLEDYSNGQKNEFTAKENNILQEYHNTRIEFLNMNLEVTSDGKVKALDKNIAKEKIQVAQKLVDTINSNYEQAKKEYKFMVDFCKDKRTILNTRVIDIQAKLRELVSTLTSQRDMVMNK